MAKLIAQIFPITVALLAVACLSCDDYNIVEPRFYDEDDLTEFGDCEGDPFVEPEGGANNSGGVVQPKTIIPTMFAVDACWHDRANGVLAVGFAMPVAGQYKLLLLNSGGGVEKVVAVGTEQAGHVVVPCVIENDGVHALSLQVEHVSVVVWFEVD